MSWRTLKIQSDEDFTDAATIEVRLQKFQTGWFRKLRDITLHYMSREKDHVTADRALLANPPPEAKRHGWRLKR